jgi:hypothetical protein
MPPRISVSQGFTTNHDLEEMAFRYDIPLRGVYSKDNLTMIIPQAGAYIINLQDQTEGQGSHWVAVQLEKVSPFSEKNESYYFDSFGVAPPCAVMDFCNRWQLMSMPSSDDMHYSDLEIQDISRGFCGEYCILFLKYMTGEGLEIPPYKRFEKFLRLFKSSVS